MELIKVFLDNLYPDDKSTPTNTDALHALEAVNDEYLSRVLPFEDYSEEFLRLYDSARDYPEVTWPQPLGEDTYKMVRELECFKGNEMRGMRR